jgi:ABC-type Zn uptake system ZnuABC Zn-binding protein ZnuA
LEPADEHAGEADLGTPIDALAPVPHNGRPLRVVATTNLVGDVAAQVGGERIDLTVLLPAGSDPHAYTATPRDMVALSDADLILANGLGLEESMLPTLTELGAGRVVVVNEGVVPLEGAQDHGPGDEEHADKEHGGVDPHTWQNVANVVIWAQNIAAAYSAMDPAHADGYSSAAADYITTLEALDADIRATLSAIPTERRKLVTDHNTFAYFADAYGFEVIGSVIPSFSSLATISAQELARLQEQMRAQGAVAIFTGNTVNPALSQQVAQDTGVRVTPLYTDSLGAAGSEADSYVEMMRLNATRIAQALGAASAQE